MQRVLGRDHPDTVASRNNLALVLDKLGWPDTAEVELPDVPSDEQGELAPDDLGTLADGPPSVADEVDDDDDAELLVREG
jgi:hypothetical protein